MKNELINNANNRRLSRRRKILFSVYCLVSIGLIVLYHPYSEGERLEPTFIVASWACLLTAPIGRLLIDNPNFLILILIVFYGTYVLYIIGLSLITSRMSRILKTNLPIIPILIHFSGSAFLLLWHEPPEEVYRYTPFDLAGCATAVGAIILYFALDWRWARQSAQISHDSR